MKQEKGVTLIALVITIIVLLILAAIAIGTVTGENGLLSKSRQAKEKTVIAEMKERLTLALYDLRVEKEEKEKRKANLLDITEEWLDNSIGEIYPNSNVYDSLEPNAVYIRITKDKIIGNFKIDEKLNIIEKEFSNLSINYGERTYEEGKIKLPVTVKCIGDQIQKVELLDESNQVIQTTDGENAEEKTIIYQIEFEKMYTIKAITKGGKTKEERIDKISTIFYHVNNKLQHTYIEGNSKVDIEYYQPYEAKIKAEEGYLLNSIEIKMGEQIIDVDATGKFHIENVTDHIIITGSTIKKIISPTIQVSEIEDNSLKVTITESNTGFAEIKYNYYANNEIKIQNSTSLSEVIVELTPNTQYTIKVVGYYDGREVSSNIITTNTISNILEYPVLTDKGVMNCYSSARGYYFDVDVECTAADALGTGAYDGNLNSWAGERKKESVNYISSGSNNAWTRWVKIDSSAYGKTLNLRITDGSVGVTGSVQVLDASENILEAIDNAANGTTKVYTYQINSNWAWLKFQSSDGTVSHYRINEIYYD